MHERNHQYLAKMSNIFLNEKDIKSHEVFNNRFFILNKKMLMVIFIWPYQKRSMKIFFRILIVTCINSMMIPQVAIWTQYLFDVSIDAKIKIYHIIQYLPKSIIPQNLLDNKCYEKYGVCHEWKVFLVFVCFVRSRLSLTYSSLLPTANFT